MEGYKTFIHSTRSIIKKFEKFFLEFLEKMKTFANFKLPRLPIPDLEQTCQRYLKSCEPLFASEKDKSNTIQAVNNFKNGIGKVTQSRLLELDKKEKNSWLEEIWLNKALDRKE